MVNVPTEHTLKSFDLALSGLKDRLTAMAHRALAMVEAAGPAFRAHDVEAAQRIVSADIEIDRAHDEVNASVLDLLARFHPVARDLRDAIAMQHIAVNVERIADHAKSIGKRTIAVSGPVASQRALDIIAHMERLVLRSFKEVIDALEARDAVGADVVYGKDSAIDQLYDDLFHVVIADLQQNPAAAQHGVQALFVGKTLERTGDRLTNIAEEIRFMSKGDAPKATREVASGQDGA